MTDYLPGTVATRAHDGGVELLLRYPRVDPETLARVLQWNSSNDRNGFRPIPKDKLGDLLLWEQDRAASVFVVTDAGTTRTDFDAFPDTRAIAESFDDEDDGDAEVDRVVDARRDAFRAAAATDVPGAVLVVVDAEDGVTTDAALLTVNGWVTTVSSFGLAVDDDQDDADDLTVILAPSEHLLTED